MYGHPSAVVAHARALAPTPGAFWRWYSGRAEQGGLFQSGFRCNTRTFCNGLQSGDRK